MTREVRECLEEMGVTDKVFARIRAASNHTDGQKALEEAKEICRKGFRSVALRYHPDHNQHLEEAEIEEKSRRFKRMKSVHDDFLKSRFRGAARRRHRKASSNFDPFGFYAHANQDLDDDLRYWDDPLIREIIRRKRARERESYEDVLEKFRKREFWQKHGLDYDEMERRKKAEPTVKLAGGKGIWYPNKSRWILQTKRPKKR